MRETLPPHVPIPASKPENSSFAGLDRRWLGSTPVRGVSRSRWLVGGALVGAVCAGAWWAPQDAATEWLDATEFGSTKFVSASWGLPTDANGDRITELLASPVMGSDYDGDGLSDAQEIVLNTAPYDEDSDGDGYSDCEELARQSDPLATSSLPDNVGISASITARGGDDKLKLVLCVHEPAGELYETAIRLGALANGQIVSVPLGRFLGLAEVHESSGSNGSRALTIEIPIHPGFVHANQRVTFFLAAGNQHLASFGSAAKIDVLSKSGILVMQRPIAVQGQGQGQSPLPGNGAIRQPIPQSTTPSIPASWVPGSICYQRSIVVGGTGIVLLHQVIEADCLQGWDTYCTADCALTVGDTYETIDPSGLIGG